MQETDLQHLARALAPYYGPRAIKRKTVPRPPIPRQREVVVVVERKETRTKTVDAGPSPLWVVVLVGAGVICLWLFLIGAPDPATLVLLAGIVGAAFAWHSSRRREEVLETFTVPVEEVRWETYEEEQPPEEVEEKPPPRHRVVAVGRGRLRFLAYPVRGRVMVVSEPTVSAETCLTLPALRDAAAARQAATALAHALGEAPHVLGPERREVAVGGGDGSADTVVLRGAEARAHELMGLLGTAVADRNDCEIRGGFLPSHSPILRALSPVSGAGGQADFSEACDRLAILDSDEQLGIEDELRRLWRSARLGLLALHGARFSALSSDMGAVLLGLHRAAERTAFHFYCPVCNAEIMRGLGARDYSLTIKSENPPVGLSASTRCRFDLDRREWVCPTCEGATTHPIPVHKLLDEILFPVYDRLMEEHKIERLQVYSKARDQLLAFRADYQRDADDLVRASRAEMERSIDELGTLRAAVAASGQSAARLVGAVRANLPDRACELEARGLLPDDGQSVVRRWEETMVQAQGALHAASEGVATPAATTAAGQRVEEAVRDRRLRSVAVCVEGAPPGAGPADITLGDSGVEVMVSDAVGVALERQDRPPPSPAHSLSGFASARPEVISTTLNQEGDSHG